MLQYYINFSIFIEKYYLFFHSLDFLIWTLTSESLNVTIHSIESPGFISSNRLIPCGMITLVDVSLLLVALLTFDLYVIIMYPSIFFSVSIFYFYVLYYIYFIQINMQINMQIFI